MSYATDKTVLKTLLETTLGYTEVPQLIEPDEAPTMANKTYVLKPEGIQTNLVTSSSNILTNVVRLEALYVNSKTTSRDANFELFTLLVLSLFGLSGFQNLIEAPKFEDYDEYRTKGTIKFYFGLRGYN